MVARREQCEGCHLNRQPEDFEKFDAKDWDEGTPRVCDHCITYGVPARDPLAKMTVQQRQGMQVLASGGSIASAARVMGVHESTIRHQLNGRDRGTFREAFQALLIDEGVGPDSIAKSLKGSLEAEKFIYSKQGELVDTVPDFPTRIRAADLAVKLLDLKPPQELSKMSDAGAGAASIQIITNIGSGEASLPVSEYEIEAERVD